MLRTGDVVFLRSGSPPMTVVSIFKDDYTPTVRTVWFVGGECKSDGFYEAELRLSLWSRLRRWFMAPSAPTPSRA